MSRTDDERSGSVVIWPGLDPAAQTLAIEHNLPAAAPLLRSTTSPQPHKVAGSRSAHRAHARPAQDARPATRQAKLRILATSDLHGHLLSWDYFAHRPQRGAGLARTAALIAAARHEVPGALLLDNGDFLQGTAMMEEAARPRAGITTRRHPAILAFEALAYDAVGIGNHEFNYGLNFLERACAEAKVPLISANVARRLGASPLEDERLLPSHVMLERVLTADDGQPMALRIAVMALTPPEILQWDRRHLHGLIEARPMLETARALVPELRAAGADVVICLAHTGMARDAHVPEPEACAHAIAAIPGIDAVIAGHSHEIWPPGPVQLSLPPLAGPRSAAQLAQLIHSARDHGRAPVVQPGHAGSHLGVIDLIICEPARSEPPRPGPEGAPASRTRTTPARHVTACRVEALSTAERVSGLGRAALAQAAKPLREAVGSYHRRTLARLRQPVGHSDLRLSTLFSTLRETDATRLISAAKLAHVRARLAGRTEAELPIVPLVAPYRAGARGGPLDYTDIAPGALSWRNVQDLYPYPNTLIAQVVTGGELALRLERAAGFFNRITPGLADQPLTNPDMAPFHFCSAPALSYAIDLAAPIASDRRPSMTDAPAASTGRIRDLCLDGRPITAGERLVLVSNSHQLGDREANMAPPLLDEGTLCAEVIAEHIRRHSPMTELPPGGWRFAPMPGTSVTADVGLAALSQLDQIAHLQPELMGTTEGGFQRLRLHL